MQSFKKLQNIKDTFIRHVLLENPNYKSLQHKDHPISNCNNIYGNKRSPFYYSNL